MKKRTIVVHLAQHTVLAIVLGRLALDQRHPCPKIRYEIIINLWILRMQTKSVVHSAIETQPACTLLSSFKKSAFTMAGKFLHYSATSGCAS